MANEIRVSISYSCVESGLTAAGAVNTTASLTGSNFVATVISATTSWVLIPLGALGNFSRIFIRNLDATNFLQVALDNGGAKIFLTLPAGEAAYFMPTSSTLYVKADTAACDYQLAANET